MLYPKIGRRAETSLRPYCENSSVRQRPAAGWPARPAHEYLAPAESARKPAFLAFTNLKPSCSTSMFSRVKGSFRVCRRGARVNRAVARTHAADCEFFRRLLPTSPAGKLLAGLPGGLPDHRVTGVERKPLGGEHQIPLHNQGLRASGGQFDIHQGLRSRRRRIRMYEELRIVHARTQRLPPPASGACQAL
jgi:hypothetical protein